jgi:CheY-like chemotaxis protein
MPNTKIKLLIVDDEPATRTLLTQIFSQMGHSVSSASDGFAALEKIREVLPDVVLSDLHMPGMSGFELLSVVRRRFSDVYVIATSGAYSGETVPHGIAADAFYEKATNFKALLQLMENASNKADLPRRGLSASVPIWMTHTVEEASGEAGFMISCPECLRTFVEVFVPSQLLIHQAECPFCQTAVHYAIVEPLDPATSQPYHQKLVAALRPSESA